MSNVKTAAIVGAGLVGLYLLSGQAGDDSGGGFGGGGGADREPGDTIITFPEMDLSQLWGQDTKKEALSIAPDWWTEHIESLESRAADLQTYESQGMTSEQAQHVDMLRRKFGQSPDDAPTKKLTQGPVTSPALARQAGFRDMFAGWFSRAGAARYVARQTPAIRPTSTKKGGSGISHYQSQGMSPAQAQRVDMLRRRFNQ